LQTPYFISSADLHALITADYDDQAFWMHMRRIVMVALIAIKKCFL